jgi:hypothetical protein
MLRDNYDDDNDYSTCLQLYGRKSIKLEDGDQPCGGDRNKGGRVMLQEAGCLPARKVLLLKEEVCTRSQGQNVYVTAKSSKCSLLSNAGIKRGHEGGVVCSDGW